MNTAPDARAPVIGRGLSLHLDAVRAAAAIVVLFSHFAYAWASGGGLQWVRDLNLGSDAVVLFFVLSGLVIAHTTSRREVGPGAYALARASRLYSVAVPALVLSFVCAALIARFNPASLAPFGWADVLGQTVRGLTFTNYIWWDSQRIAVNGPYWSVAYEFWYYVLFGMAVYLRGRVRVWAITLTALLLGPKILLLAPCWLAGVALHRWLRAGAADHLSRARAWRLAVGPWIAYAGLLAVDAPAHLSRATWLMSGRMHPNDLFGFSDEFLWNFVLAVLFTAHFLGVAGLVRARAGVLEAAAGPIRWIAGRTFSLYLFHMPLLKLGSALPGYDAADPLHAAGLLAGVAALCLALAEVTERKLGVWRAMFGGVAAFIAGAVASRRLVRRAG